jgi:aminopeptidase N
MRRLWPALGLGFILFCLAVFSAACRAPEPPAPSYLVAYQPALKEVAPADEAAWASFPRYSINATLDVEKLTLTGQETVTFTNRQPNDLTQIGFRLYPNLPQQGGHLSIHSVAANGYPVEYTNASLGAALIIHCDPPLKPQQSASLDIRFSLTIPDRPQGYSLFGRSQNIISIPSFYPSLAVLDNEGWHVTEMAPRWADAGFSESSFYDVSFTTDPNWVVVATGRTISQTRRDDGLITSRIVAGPIREFAVIASPDYEVETTQAYGTQVRSYFLRQDRTAGLAALERAASALRVYSDAYGPYPFAQMDVVEAPLEYHGMEYSMLNMLGIDVYRGKRKDLSYLVIHETAHQWWYSQVGNNPERSPWLDEGLAEYSAYTYYLMTQGRQSADALRDQRWIQAFMYARENGMDAVMQQDASSFPDAQVYEIVVYAKAALFFDALRRAVGDETYFAILREYLHRYRFQIVRPEHLTAVIQDVAGRDPTPLITEWVLTAAQ